MIIEIVLFGELDPAISPRFPGALADRFAGIGVLVKTYTVKAGMLGRALNEERKQHASGYYLDFLDLFPGISRKQNAVKLGILPVDLYSDSSPSLNFIFGEARLRGASCIVSVHRLRAEFYGFKRNDALFHDRLVKEALHEIGHVLGAGHCRNELCVMHFSNSIHDTDLKYPEFCSTCRVIVQEKSRKRSNN